MKDNKVEVLDHKEVLLRATKAFLEYNQAYATLSAEIVALIAKQKTMQTALAAVSTALTNAARDFSGQTANLTFTVQVDGKILSWANGTGPKVSDPPVVLF